MVGSLATPLDLFYQWEASVPTQVFLRQPNQGVWYEYTWSQVSESVRRVAGYLRAQCFPSGSCIGIIAGNCADWIIVDLAIMLSGHVSVPLYPGQDIESGQYILRHCDAQLVFVGKFSKPEQADALLGGSLPRVAMQGCEITCTTSLIDITANAPRFNESPVFPLETVFTIIYTSGTTGKPKGVVHSYAAPASVVPSRIQYLPSAPKGERERFFSYLPLSHVAERCGIALRAIYNNAVLSFSEGPASFAHELKSVQPTGFFAVPRLWEKFKATIDAQFSQEQQSGFGELEKLKIREMLGLASARVITTGAAATSPAIYAWYRSMGIVLRNAYGMTENFIDGCVNTSNSPCDAGCVGKPLPGVELRFTEDGEICFRSAGLMLGYYKDPDHTDLVLQNGWYFTGDRGYLDEEGRLVVSGRLGDIFKTGKGKFVNPVDIEALLGHASLLTQVCVFGQGLAQPVALATLSADADIHSRARVELELKQLLVNVNDVLAPHERLRCLGITENEWTADNQMLTPTLKIKRKWIEKNYTKVLSSHNALIIWC